MKKNKLYLLGTPAFGTVLVACGKKDSGSGGGSAASGGEGGAVKGTGKNYTLNKESDFVYDLTTIDGTEYVVIKDVNLPYGFKKMDVVNNVLVDTLTVKIPAKIEGYPVGEIRTGSEDRRYITSVTLPNTLVKIGKEAFLGTPIRSITIPDSVVEIGEQAFYVSGITSIKLPKNLKKLGKEAFKDCKNLGSSLNISEGITEIPDNAFAKTKITEVIIPDSVTVIGGDAFRSCGELTTVKVSSRPIKYLSNPISMFDGAFLKCGKLSLATRKAI
jgi:hypothetical protein